MPYRALLVAAGIAGTAHAADLDTLRPTSDPSGFLVTDGAGAPPDGSVGVSSWLRASGPDGGGEPAAFTWDLGAWLGIGPASLAVDAPLVLHAGDRGTGWRDLRLTPRLVAWQAGVPLALAVSVPIGLPVGDVDAGRGEVGPTLTPTVALEVRDRPEGGTVRAALNLGWRFRPQTMTRAGAIGDELVSRVALAVRVRPTLEAGVDAEGRFGTRARTALEVVPWARLRAGPLRVTAAVAGAPGRGVGTPSWRVFLGASAAWGWGRGAALQWPRSKNDIDGDGITFLDDACPDEPEDFDGIADLDGCPDETPEWTRTPASIHNGLEYVEAAEGGDLDMDSIPDDLDGCPSDPESFNGYEDDDGCPDVAPVVDPTRPRPPPVEDPTIKTFLHDPAPRPDSDVRSAPTEPEPVVIERAPTVESPRSVRPGQEFTVLVSLTEAQLTPDVVPVSGGTPEGNVRLSLPGDRSSWTLEVVLTGMDLEMKGGVNTRPITLRPTGDSDVAAFQVTALDLGAPYDETLYVTFLHEGAFLARVKKELHVGPATAVVQPGADPVRPITPVLLGIDQLPPDLSVHIVHPDLNRPDAALITVFSPYFAPKTASIDMNTTERDGWIRSHLGKIATQTRSMPALPNLEDLSAVTMHLEGFGTTLWRKFTPPIVREAWTNLHDRLGDKFRTIQVITDDPAFPWELLDPDVDGAEAWGLQFVLARWHIDRADAIRPSPPTRIPMDRLMVVAPAYAGDLGLPAVRDELLLLSTLAGFVRVPANLLGLQAALSRPGGGILHYAGHGTVSADAHRYAIQLEDGALDPLTWSGGILPEGSNPLVFFNACDVGQANTVGTFVDGWAPAVLESGAPGYIGGLWPLHDRAAAEFSQAFYTELSRRLKADGRAVIGDVLRDARQRYLETGDPTFLAYAFFGHPDLTIVVAPR